MSTTTEDVLPGIPRVESPLFERIFQEKQLSPETLDVARRLRRDGFAIIDFPDPDFEHISGTIIRALDECYDWHGWREGRVLSLRAQDAWKTVPEIKRIACNLTILQLLSDLYGKEAFPFQTLNFPVGTQQRVHSDSAHFSSCPERFLVGVWLALEDTDSDNGPLVYYPGSHTLPVFTNELVGRNPDWGTANPYKQYLAYEKAWEALTESLELKPLQFQAKKGQALIWSANLLHGGAAQNDITRTRHSQVTHYFFKGCSYYSPLETVPFLGEIRYREVLDIGTGQSVPSTINAQSVVNHQPSPKAHSVPNEITGKLKLWERLQNVIATNKPNSLPEGFDGIAYLKANPDLRAANVDPARHWLKYGYKEGRSLR